MTLGPVGGTTQEENSATRQSGTDGDILIVGDSLACAMTARDLHGKGTGVDDAIRAGGLAGTGRDPPLAFSRMP
jgi:hypothetical protein